MLLLPRLAYPPRPGGGNEKHVKAMDLDGFTTAAGAAAPSGMAACGAAAEELLEGVRRGNGRFDGELGHDDERPTRARVTARRETRLRWYLSIMRGPAKPLQWATKAGSVDSAREKDKARAVAEIYRFFETGVIPRLAPLGYL